MSRYSDLILGETGLVSYWRLGELSGTVADSKGSDNGTLVNSPTTGVAGALPDDPNTAMTFLAASLQHITLGATGSGLGNGPYSFESWFKTNASGANFAIFDAESLTGAAGDIGYGLGNLANGKVSVTDGANRIISSGTTLYNDGKWHHVVITKIVAGNVWKMYVDGNDVTTADSFPTQATTSGVGANGRIGVAYNAGVQRWFWTGSLDEIAIYNVALTQAQAYTHFTTGLQSNYGYEPVYANRPLARRRRMRVRFLREWSADTVGGPQNLSLTASDTVTTADTATRTATFLRTGTDALTTADTVTRTQSLLRTTSDTVTTADVVTRVLGAFRTTTDAVSATQVATRTATFLRSATDTLTSSDAATRIGTFLRTTTDAVTLSDVATDLKTRNVTATDAVTTSDAATRLEVLLRTGTDAVSATQAATRILAGLRTGTDAVTFSDNAIRTDADARLATDAVTAADTGTRTGTFVRSASDAVTTSDAVVATQNMRTTVDAVSTSDVATAGQVLFRTASDAVSLSDAATASGGQVVSGGGAVANPGYGKRVLREMTQKPVRKPTIEKIRRETVLVATSDRLTIRDASVAVVEFTQDEADLEVLLAL